MPNLLNQQLDLIASMLDKGHGFSLCPHTLPLWGTAIGLHILLLNYYWLIAGNSNMSSTVIISLIIVLISVFFIDKWLTLRRKERQEAVVPLVQKQVMSMVGFCVCTAIILELLAHEVGTNPVLRSYGVIIVSIVLFTGGLFSKRWYCWAASAILLLNTTFVIRQPEYYLQVLFNASVFIVGFICIQLFSNFGNSWRKHIIASVLLVMAIILSTFITYSAHQYWLQNPRSLPVYNLSEIPAEPRFIVDIPSGTTLTATLSTDRWSIQPLKVMPDITLKTSKKIRWSYSKKDSQQLFKVGNDPWMNREPFQITQQRFYAHVDLSTGLRMEFFLPYFLSKECGCMEIVGE